MHTKVLCDLKCIINNYDLALVDAAMLWTLDEHSV